MNSDVEKVVDNGDHTFSKVFSEMEGGAPTAATAETTLTGLSTVKPLPAAPTDAVMAHIQVQVAGVAMTLDGTDPTSSYGFQYMPLAEIKLSKAEFLAAKFLQLSAGAVLQIYWRKS